MENIKSLLAHGIIKKLKWAFLILFGLFIILVVARAIYLYNKNKSDAITNVEVEKIHNTKLTLDDVMGKNLPPDPRILADKTVEGIDANNNGIRDDVERAIFAAYPNSAKTRAVLLQYALALQMEVIQPVINTETVTAVAKKTSAGYFCIGQITPRSDMKNFIKIGNALHNFVENKQINTEVRNKTHHDFYQNNLGSYELPSECDIDYSKLPN